MFDGVGNAASDVVIAGLAMAESLVVLTTTDDVVLLLVDVWVVVPVVDVVLDDEKLVVVVVDAESLVVIATVGGAGSGVRTGSVRTGSSVGVTGGYSVVVAYAVSLAMTVGSSGGSARAGTISMESSIKEIATPEASTTAAPRHKPIRRGAFILAQPLSLLTVWRFLLGARAHGGAPTAV